MTEHIKTIGCLNDCEDTRSVCQPLLLLTFIECAWIFLLLTCQWTHSGMGLAIWPNNEDTNYYMMLESGGIKGIPSLFWIFDSRNPLNPWYWVVLLSTVNYSQGYELFAASRLVDLILGISVYLLMDLLTDRRCRSYSLAAGIAVLIWPFARADHVVWAFNLALAMSIFNLYCYGNYVKSGRRNGRWLASGLLLYFLTISTYTLHLWGILAIPAISLLLHQHDQARQPPWYAKLGSGCLDLMWYISFLVTYFLIWDTTSPFSAPARSWMNVNSIASQLPLSLANLVVSRADMSFVAEMTNALNWKFLMVTCALVTAFYAVVFHKICSLKANRQEAHITGLPSFGQLAASLGIVAALSAGIVQVESTTSIWAPGTRTPMVQKVVQPCLMVITVFFMARLVPRQLGFLRQHFLINALVCVCLLGSMMALNNNRIKWRITAEHTRTLTKIMTAPSIQSCTCKNLVIILDKSTDVFLPTFQFRKYMALKLAPHADSVTMIRPASGRNKLTNYKSVILEDDDKGVALRYPKQINGFTMVPYDQVAFFRYTTTGGLQNIASLQEQDLHGTDASVLRKEWPVRLSASN